MEAKKTTCPDCGHIRYWTSRRERLLEQTPELLAQIEKKERTCARCGSINAETDLTIDPDNEIIVDDSENTFPVSVADTLIDQIDEKTRSSF
ncbi:hypothetical protein K8R32_01530 [bacterium]|nr:hypothetical protein [bacterium]